MSDLGKAPLISSIFEDNKNSDVKQDAKPADLMLLRRFLRRNMKVKIYGVLILMLRYGAVTFIKSA